MFNLSRELIIGLDISDLSVKIVQLRKKGKRLSLVSAITKPMPVGIVDQGQILKSKDLSDFIRLAIKEVAGEKIKTNQVVCNLPEEKVFMRVIQLPKIKPEDIDQTVRWEAENHIPFNINNVYLDWHLIETTEPDNKTNVFIAAIPKETADEYLNCLKGAHLKTVALIPESVGLIRSLVKKQSYQEAIMAIDLGLGGFNFVIFSAGAIRFTSRVSDLDFNQVIEEKLGLSQKKAEALKMKVGLNPKKDEAVYKALSPVADQLAEKINEYINFYIGRFDRWGDSNKKIDQIILCGGESFLSNLPQYLTNKIGISVKQGNPLVNIYPENLTEIKSLKLDINKSLVYSTALGMALSGLDNND